MYLTKLSMDIHHPSIRRALADANDMHRNLMAAFDAELPMDARSNVKLLYRVFDETKATYVLMSSETPPNEEALRRNGYRFEGIRDTSSLEKAFTVGKMMRFELLTSPSKKVAGEGKNSQRRFITESDKRLEWLKRKAEQNGFGVELATEDGNFRRISGDRKGANIQYTAVNFRGVLSVKDSALFWRAYCEGIGAGKAYGMGMLMLSSL